MNYFEYNMYGSNVFSYTNIAFSIILYFMDTVQLWKSDTPAIHKHILIFKLFFINISYRKSMIIQVCIVKYKMYTFYNYKKKL